MRILGHGIDLLNVERFSSIFKKKQKIYSTNFSINEDKKIAH